MKPAISAYSLLQKSTPRSAHLLHRSLRGNAGYTLFEIMIVLSIISVLVGTAIYLLVGNIDLAKEQRVDADMQSIGIQLKTYEIQNYTMPTTEQGLEALVTKPGGDPAPRRWRQLLEKIPLDPWGTPYVYRNPPRTPNTKGYDLFSLGADKKESADDLGH
ncbi:MAG: type II secretion system major pseudopilin GspG [Chthoniobacterales bacterium]